MYEIIWAGLIAGWTQLRRFLIFYLGDITLHKPSRVKLDLCRCCSGSKIEERRQDPPGKDGEREYEAEAEVAASPSYVREREIKAEIWPRK
jgi:hypothetical protein